MRIFYHPRFTQSYARLPLAIKKKAEDREVLFRTNPFHLSLDTHKLRGKLKRFWSFSVNRQYRILFEFSGPEVIFLDVGDHNIYR